MRGIVLSIIGLAMLLAPSYTAAQLDSASTELKERVVIKESGRIFVNGRPSSKPKLDLLDDKYVFRYKVVDGQDTYVPLATIEVQLPEAVDAATIKPDILAVHGVGPTDYKIINRSMLVFTAQDLTPGATLTLVIDLPKEAFHLRFWSQILSTVQTLPPAGLIAIGILIPAISILYTLLIFAKRFRDIFLQPAKAAQVQPPANLPPAMVGTLLNGYVGMREISATLIDLARRGYIDIIYRGGVEFAFSKKRSWQYDKTLLEYERLFLDQIFSEDFLSESGEINQKLNKHIWSDSISKGIESLYTQMVQLGYFPEDPRQSHIRVRFIGMLFFFVSVVGLLFTLFFFEHRPVMALPWLVSMVSTPIMLHLALLVPNRTAAGREQAKKWLTFRSYLAGATIDTGSSVDLTELYERYLAYSIVLSVEGYWTQQFIELPCRIPDWFYSERLYIDSYAGLAKTLFGIIGFISEKFSGSRNPTAV